MAETAGSGNVGGLDPCAQPGNLGCPCTEEGASVECGKIVSQSGDYVTCLEGLATCDGKLWGPCVGNRVVAKSHATELITTGGKRTLAQSSGCDNACDPFCTRVVGEKIDIDAGGVDVTDAGISITETTGTGGPGTGPCRGLWCQVQTCSGQPKTSISGAVYDPAGKNPLYNAYVYIPVDPKAELPKLTEGVSCDTCAGAGSVSAIAVAQTGPDGKFTLNNVPSGSGVPLVVQMGKWRRKITLPNITECKDNLVGADNSRLPRNRFDGDGNLADIPRMAIASGSADPFECLLLKAGIDAAEIQIPGKGARIDYYRYNGIDRDPGGAPAGSTLTGSLDALKQYDVVLLPCEGGENAHNTQAPNLVKFAAIGGRIFTTHYGYVWLATPSPRGVASNLTEFYGTANWDIGRNDYTDPMTGYIDQSFPKGIAYAEWMRNVGASSTLGRMSINEPRHNAVSSIAGKSQRWVYGASKVAAAGTNDMLLAMTFNTPVGAAQDQQCGRVVFSDFHVSADALVSSSGCSSDADCGFGAVCNPATRGTCSPLSCKATSDCGAGYTCDSATTGSCSRQSCRASSECGGTRSCSGGSLGSCSITCDVDGDCRSVSRSSTCSGASTGTCSARACTRNSDCGVGRCSRGQCTLEACTVNSDCGSTRTCQGASAGKCSMPSGGISCSVNSDCSSYGTGGTCEGGSVGTCSSGTCFSAVDCGSSGTCSGGTLGTCRKSCTSDVACGTSLTCVGGRCEGCATNSACPSNNCAGALSAACSNTAKLFPMTCRNGDLTSQEKALEFMLFDLSACVSPDSWSPPMPTTEYHPATFNLDFAADCPTGQLPLWRELQWQALIPTSASIDFKVGTSESSATLADATVVDLAVATTDTPTPSFDAALIDTSVAGAFFGASPRITSGQYLRVVVTLNPTTDLKASPTLSKWQVVYDCKDSL